MSENSAILSLSKVASTLGKGLAAGLAGTLAITVSQMIEMKLTNRGMSDAPAKVGGDVLGVEPKGEAELEKRKADHSSNGVHEVEDKVAFNKDKFSQLMHFGYGTGWGEARGIMDLIGIRGLLASLLHFGAVWGTALVMLPAKNAAQPVTKWPPKQIVIDVIHHAVYALAAGVMYDAMSDEEKRATDKIH